MPTDFLLVFVNFVCFCSFVPSGGDRRVTNFFISGVLSGRFLPMHPLFRKADQLSHTAIGAAIEVHRHKGPGLLESIYERCMMRELSLRNVTAVNQRLVKIEYKGLVFEEPLRLDLLLDDCLLLELKSVQEVHPIHQAQLLSYMKLLDIPIGLIINFHQLKLTEGVTRMMLPGANL